jgi:PAS domain S-box-containing protein
VSLVDRESTDTNGTFPPPSNQFLDAEKFDLAQAIDSDAVRSLFESFYLSTGMACGIKDAKGKVLVAIGWQDVCTKFHRKHSQSFQHCVECDAELSRNLGSVKYNTCHCRNGMWDVALPIVYSDNLVGKIVCGQFLYAEETINLEQFKEQAKKYGYDEVEYLSALERVPRFSRAKVAEAIGIYLRLSQIISALIHNFVKTRETAIDKARTEQVIKSKDSYLESIFRSAPIGIGVVVNRVFTQVNLRLSEITGYSANELIGKGPRTLYPDDNEYIFVGNEKYEQIEKLGTGTVETRWVRKDGRIVDVLLSSTPIDLSDHSKGVTFTALDITDRKYIERYRQLSVAALSILNETERLDEALSRILPEIKKTTRCDAVGIRLKKDSAFPYFTENGFPNEFLIAENSLAAVDAHGSTCRNEDGSIKLECTCGLVISGKADLSNPIFTEGGSAWINNSQELLSIPEGEDPRLHPRNRCFHLGYLSVALVPIRIQKDIVGLLQINGRERNLFTLGTIHELEGLATHIGSAILRSSNDEEKKKLQSQLNQSQKMESVGRLAGGVAHDFNNMLGVILGHSEMLLEEIKYDHQFHHNLIEIRTAAERSANLTRQLLAFARKQAIVPKVLDFNKTIEGMLSMLRRLIGENIKLVWAPCNERAKVKMDPSQIDQILANLCVNARDAITDVGKITIETCLKTLDAEYCSRHIGFVPGEFVALTVSDSGCGMDKETLANIFEPFFTTKDQGRGTGLGLSTIYGVVKQNRGFVNVYSEIGHGTTFRIYIPREVNLDPAEHHPFQGEAVGGSETILIVEDEPAILEMTKIMLQRMGYVVLEANSVREAIRIAEEKADKIDILLTDVVMPEMNGRDLAELIKNHTPEISIIFMSGYTPNVVAQHGIFQEGEYFVQKPFTRHELAKQIRMALSSRISSKPAN